MVRTFAVAALLLTLAGCSSIQGSSSESSYAGGPGSWEGQVALYQRAGG
jgi:hypothetical protein